MPPLLNASSIVPNFQDQQMNLLAHAANYRPADDYLSNLASFAEQDVVRQPNASAPAPAAALVPASPFPQEVAAAADRRPVQGFSDLLSEAIDQVPSMCSLEDEHFWKDLLAESNHLPL
jgi:myb proto-oncogene protein